MLLLCRILCSTKVASIIQIRNKAKKCQSPYYQQLAFLPSGATSNRKSACIALFLNKLYLYYDVSPLNKVFTTLHRSTQVCVLGSISACKGRYLFGIINISKNFFLYLLLRVCLNFVQHSFRSCFEDFSLYH